MILPSWITYQIARICSLNLWISEWNNGMKQYWNTLAGKHILRTQWLAASVTNNTPKWQMKCMHSQK
jgi:hypothetical protein